MIRSKLVVSALVFMSLIAGVSTPSAIASVALYDGGASNGEPGGEPAVPAVNPQPDLTPPGYVKGDPLYNDPEVKLGRAAADDLSKQAKFCQDKAIVARVQAIGAKIAAVADTVQVQAGFGNDKVMPYHYTYHVIDSKEVNAFSLPGGSIYIYKGMLDLITSDDELAGVLGHETAHAAHHHVSTLDKEANKMSNSMLLAVLGAIIGRVPPEDIVNLYSGASYGEQGVLNNKFSEHAEEDADHTGMIFMLKAGYNPVGMLTMLERLEQQDMVSPDIDMGFLQDHPLTPDRVAAAKDELAGLGYTVDVATVRAADGSLPVAISSASASTLTVTLSVSKEPIIVLAASDRPELVAAALELDKLLDKNLQLGEIKSVGPELIAREHVLLTVTPADAAAQNPPSTPQDMAAAASTKLRQVLWSQVVTGVDP